MLLFPQCQESDFWDSRIILTQKEGGMGVSGRDLGLGGGPHRDKWVLARESRAGQSLARIRPRSTRLPHTIHSLGDWDLIGACPRTVKVSTELQSNGRGFILHPGEGRFSRISGFSLSFRRGTALMLRQFQGGTPGHNTSTCGEKSHVRGRRLGDISCHLSLLLLGSCVGPH